MSQITVKICGKCSSIRIDNKGRCKDCRKLESKKYREKYPERIGEHQRKNPGYSKSKSLEWRIKNKEIINSDQYKEINRQRASDWYKNNSEKAKLYRLKYYIIHKENFIKRSKCWKAKNPQKVSQSNLKRYWANPDYIRQKNKEWRKRNPESVRIHRQNRRARKNYNGGKLTPGLAKMLYKEQNGKCACCGKELNNVFHLDHIMPLFLGGENIDSNIQLLTPRCNLQKHKKHPDDFMKERKIEC